MMEIQPGCNRGKGNYHTRCRNKPSQLITERLFFLTGQIKEPCVGKKNTYLHLAFSQDTSKPQETSSYLSRRRSLNEAHRAGDGRLLQHKDSGSVRPTGQHAQAGRCGRAAAPAAEQTATGTLTCIKLTPGLLNVTKTYSE